MHPSDRQKEILDSGPRIAPVPVGEVGQEAVEILQALRAAAGLAESAEIPEFVATLLRHPQLYSRHAAIGVELLTNGTLSARQRELAILRTGWLCGAPFEWGEHVGIAKRIGLSSDEVERLTQNADAAGWNEADRAIVSAAEELHRNATISDPTWQALAAFMDEPQLIELVYVVGHYTKLAYLQNALRVRLAPGNTGLAER